jgi:hypothetical protein
MQSMSDNMNRVIASKGNVKKANPAAHPHHKEPGGKMGKLLTPNSTATSPIGHDSDKLREDAASIHQIRLSAQRELELAKQLRVEAQRYKQDTEIKARSQAQQLLLRARLATQKEMKEFIHKEIEVLVRKASAETHKMLADIRTVRITAQEELAALRKFTDAAKIYSLSMTLQKETGETEEKREKQLAGKK